MPPCIILYARSNLQSKQNGGRARTSGHDAVPQRCRLIQDSRSWRGRIRSDLPGRQRTVILPGYATAPFRRFGRK